MEWMKSINTEARKLGKKIWETEDSRVPGLYFQQPGWSVDGEEECHLLKVKLRKY